MLGGCGATRDGDEIDPPAPVAVTAEAEAEASAETSRQGFLARLLGRSEPGDAVEAPEAPEGGAETAPIVAADGAALDSPDTEDAAQPGFFARLFAGPAAQDAQTSADPVPVPDDDSAVEPSADTAQSDAPDGAAQDAPPRRGFLARLFAGPSAEDADTPSDPVSPDETPAAIAQSDQPVVAAVVVAEDAPELNDHDGLGDPDAEAMAETPRRTGFFARLFSGGGQPEGGQIREGDDLGPGDALPFGVMARVCSIQPAQMGQQIARFPERGRADYAIYDTDPGSAQARSLYLTGFSDGCARKVTAAMALFGDARTYELLRYGPTGELMPLGATDAAYDRIKRQVCGVGQSRPCGDAIERLAGEAVFVSIYPRMGSNPDWQTLLLHAGYVAALDVKSR